MKKRLLWRKFLLASVGTLVALLAGEIALRLIEPRTDVEVLTEGRLDSGKPYYYLIPNSSGLLLGRQVSVNAAGYRGKLVDESRTAGVVRIGVFGDSHTFGMGASDAATYPAVLEDLLKKGGENRCEVLNFGVMAHDFSQILHHAYQFAFRFHLDIVLLTYHQGDLLEGADFVFHAGHASVGAQKANFGSSVSIAKSLRRLRDQAFEVSAFARLLIPRMTGFVRKAGVVHNIGITEEELAAIERNDPSWQEWQKDTLAFISAARKKGMTVGLVLFPSMRGGFAHHPAAPLYQALSRWCQEQGIPCVNLLPFYEGLNANQMVASLLDRHPNEEAYAIAAKGVAPMVSKMIQNTCRGDLDPGTEAVIGHKNH